MARCEVPAIPISFKKTPEDIALRNWIMSHSGKSAFCKDILRAAMLKELEEKEKEEKLKQLYK